MKKLLIFLLATLTLASCSGIRKSINSGGGEVTGVGATYYSEPTPYGMVLVECGSMKEGPAQRDSLWGIDSTARGVSVDAFWMDENEVTNSKYKQFVYWVRDSIIRERLADPAYGGNEEFKIEEDKEGNPITPRLNWNRNIPWKNPSEDEERAIESVYRYNPITGKKELDPRQMNYRYEVYNLTEAAKRRNRFDPKTRDYNTDHAVPTTTPTISKDTAYIDDDGRIIRQTITRALQSDYDFLNTYIVNIFPDTTCWINDFENSYNEPYVRLYFANGNYNNHPVVGVSWEQANAFCHWRTEFLKKSLGKDGVYIEPFRLPTEAEWEYAARAGKNENIYPWDGNLPLTEDEGCFYANFKPNEGNYVRDGSIITSPVGTYEPNDNGLFDMAGNVSEWTSTSYIESIDRMTNDLNPEYRYDISIGDMNGNNKDPYKMSRKIVRGGSWKDVAHNIRSDIRMWEYQNEQRSYIGFRCVRTKVGFTKSKRKNNCCD
ncbi:MAG: SUMF1/EgtB/PvdO family nonheme iron enzyme [Muribaculaceae bacterium]|nr:SUMF1/EgtB/PvdO family nonheme iron enzyme [Muribaculaceae bacterium]